MKILGIDSSGNVASVAIVENDILIAEFTINNKKTHSITLLPMLDEVVKMAAIELEEIDAIAVASGPGSFTGLRIGSSTVKGLALALDKPVVSVPTLEALAYNIFSDSSVICPIMDARRNQVYTAAYLFSNNHKHTCIQDNIINYASMNMEVIINQDAMEIIELIDKLNIIGKPVVFVGDGINIYKNTIDSNLNVKYQFAPPHLNRQRAGAVAALGLLYFLQGKGEDGDLHRPEYLRKPQAEREQEEKTKLEQEEK